MKCPSYDMFFEVMSNKTRMKIIEALQKADLSVTEICNITKEEQSKISHNLKILADCNFISAKQEGKKRIYSINKDTILPLMELVNKHVQTFCCEKCKVQHG